MHKAGFLRRFRDPIRVPRIREIGSLQVQTGYLTFSIKKAWHEVQKEKHVRALHVFGRPAQVRDHIFSPLN